MANELSPEAGQSLRGGGLCWGLGQLPGRMMETPAEPQGPLSPCSPLRQGKTCHEAASCGLWPAKPHGASLAAQSHFSFIGFQNEPQNGS